MQLLASLLSLVELHPGKYRTMSKVFLGLAAYQGQFFISLLANRPKWDQFGYRVESRCGAVILQVRNICRRLFRLAVPYYPDHKSRFHTPLIEPDVRF
ncbi:hypothetical protein [Serratia ficaria]|uniref:hypothetical protein n=1 Tax=Serratia ficaria TaxID=61651 RepID=UPI000A448E84|nr:hypothetical protein [Serratia ficaria]